VKCLGSSFWHVDRNSRMKSAAGVPHFTKSLPTEKKNHAVGTNGPAVPYT